MNEEEALLFKEELDRIKEDKKSLCLLGNSLFTFGLFLAVLLIIIETLNVIDGTGTHTLLPYAIIALFFAIDIICLLIAHYICGAQYQYKLNELRMRAKGKKELKR